MMEIFRILDELEVAIKESKQIPFSNGKVLIESHRFLDRLDRIRLVLPDELEKARSIMYEKEKIVKEACADAEEFILQSQGKAKQMLDENEITRNAMEQAEEILTRAEEVSKNIREDAGLYAEEILDHMERVLARGLDAIIKGKKEIGAIIKDEGI